jgi:hypothetical protein
MVLVKFISNDGFTVDHSNWRDLKGSNQHLVSGGNGNMLHLEYFRRRLHCHWRCLPTYANYKNIDCHLRPESD